MQDLQTPSPRLNDGIDPGKPAPGLLIFGALVIGVLLGILAPAPEQRGVDGSLVLAGIVNYPPQSPMAAYFLDSWTIIHQFGALLLRAGIDQNSVNALIFLLPCALLVCGYAMIVYGFSGRFLLSLLAGPLCYLANPLAPLFASPDYTTLGLLWSQASEGTYGFWAHAGAVWVIGCVAAGRYALAGFSALVLIAAHPVLGAYMTALLAATFVVGRFFFRLDMPGLAKGAAWGACVTLLSLAAYFKTRSGFSAPIDQAAYEAYLRLWDVHRSHSMTLGQAMRIAGGIAVAIAGLTTFIVLDVSRRNSAVLACALVLLAVTASTIAYYAVHLAPEFLPALVLRAVPARLLNVQAFVSTPLALAVAISVADRSVKTWKTEAFVWTARIMPAAVLLLIVVSATAYALQRRHAVADYARTILETRILGKIWPAQQQSEAFWRDVRNAGVTGLVLTSSAASASSLYHGHLSIALYAQGFDFIPYLPQTASAVAQIIQTGYGVSFSNPPSEIRNGARLPVDAGQTYWVQLGPDDWCRMSRDLAIVALVAPSNWTVKLPILVPGPELTLYAVSCR